MNERIVRRVKHWIIMQVIFAQSPSGRARTKRLIGLWMAVLGVIFALLAADLYVDGNKLNQSYTTAPEEASALAPAR